MADGITIKFDQSEYERWSRKVRQNLQYQVNGELGEYGDEMARWISEHYLHGQAMRRITGTTIKAFGVRWSRREKAYVLSPGYGVQGSQAYLNRYVGTKHEFVRPGYNVYIRQNPAEIRVRKAVDRVLKEMDK